VSHLRVDGSSLGGVATTLRHADRSNQTTRGLGGEVVWLGRADETCGGCEEWASAAGSSPRPYEQTQIVRVRPLVPRRHPPVSLQQPDPMKRSSLFRSLRRCVSSSRGTSRSFLGGITALDPFSPIRPTSALRSYPLSAITGRSGARRPARGRRGPRAGGTGPPVAVRGATRRRSGPRAVSPGWQGSGGRTRRWGWGIRRPAGSGPRAIVWDRSVPLGSARGSASSAPPAAGRTC
jgi:hypothetical protein